MTTKSSTVVGANPQILPEATSEHRTTATGHGPFTTERWSTSVEVASAVGALDLSALLPWHRELASAVADLAIRADAPWSVGPGDPTVALLRIVARLAATAPTTTSPLAGQLLDALELAGIPIVSASPTGGPHPTQV